jgi:hypothetical protein
MSRPKTKAELQDAAVAGFDKLMAMVAVVPPEISFDLTGAGEEAHWARDKNVRDILIHLYEWHKLLLEWVDANRAGNAKPFLPEPYTWKTYGDMNVEFHKKHQATSHADALKMVQESHAQVYLKLDEFSDAELWTRGHFDWVGGSTLGQYFVSTTVAHYDWAMKKLKKLAQNH